MITQKGFPEFRGTTEAENHAWLHRIAGGRAVLLADVLDKLPNDYREIVIQRHLEGLTFPEIAARMGLGSNSIQKLWVKALARIGSILLQTDNVSASASTSALPLDDFRLIREIGRGSIGIVYEAEQLSARRRVALKMLAFTMALNVESLNRINKELQMATTLHHSNVLPVYTVGCERGVHFYAMHLVEGESLSEIIRGSRARRDGAVCRQTEAPAPKRFMAQSYGSPAYVRAATRLCMQAAEALEHAHQRGLIHGNIKPSNLMVDIRDNLWVTDFAMPRLPGNAGLPPVGQAAWLRYISPEQVPANQAATDHRTDIYSLGAILYELLTLAPPFAGKEREELLRQITFDIPTRPRRLSAAIPPELEVIVLKALEKKPQDRYATAQCFADDLRLFLEGKPVHARPPGLFSGLAGGRVGINPIAAAEWPPYLC